MRYSTAAVVASLAIGQAAAGSAHRHMHMHKAREAAPEPVVQDAKWWSTAVDWDSVFGNNKPQPTAAPASANNAAPAPAAPVVTAAAVVPVVDSASPYVQAQTPTSSASSSATTHGSSSGDIVGALTGLVGDAMKKLNIQPAASDGTCNEGNDGPYTMELTNNAGSDLMFICWGKNHGYQSSFLNAVAPSMIVSVGSGNTKTVSFNEGASGACAPLYHDTVLTEFGQLKQTWLEYTMAGSGVVDVSREVFANGNHIAATVHDTGCVSDMETCVFKCPPGQESCLNDYMLHNCSGPGAQIDDSKKNGGCGWNGSNGAHIKVEFH